MPLIYLETVVNAPIGRVFDLARSIDAHIASTEGTGERAVAGVTRGLIGLGEEVTWEAFHLGRKRRLTVTITAMDRPHSFEDRMVRGDFASMHHRHEFVAKGDATLMIDRFSFAAPFGLLGRLAEGMFLTGYMTRLLRKRAAVLKELAESDRWREFLSD